MKKPCVRSGFKEISQSLIFFVPAGSKGRSIVLLKTYGGLFSLFPDGKAEIRQRHCIFGRNLRFGESL